jgi:hypothetical protein
MHNFSNFGKLYWQHQNLWSEKLMAEKLTMIEIDAITGIETVRELTDKELLERSQQTELAQVSLDARQAARESALAKLAALGLTEAEIAAL